MRWLNSIPNDVIEYGFLYGENIGRHSNDAVVYHYIEWKHARSLFAPPF